MTEANPRPLGDELTTRIYLLLLRMPNPRRAALLHEGFTESEVASALASLQRRGMVDASRREVIEVFPPDATLPAYAAELDRQARATRSAIDGLAHMYYEARSGESGVRTSPEVSLLDTVDEIESAFFRAGARAESRIVRLIARSERMDRVVIRHAESILADRPTTTPRNLERLVVFEQSILEVEGAFSALETMRADGIDVRLTPHLAFSVLAVDRSVAVIDISHLEPGGGGSLYVQQRQLASALMDMCIGLYALSTPLPRTPSGPALRRLTERDGQILALLAAGASDLTIARQLTISQRTVERRVRMIMDELGATTRFQAGTNAVRRGFL
ncbi:helix-turn-helix transcriptional regulator [Knoellia subterranea]|uniref:helix-turn-helix transcriptional regulator n=1 Tax=Knoellia subterranea TaxID=184882 RepID=UPI000A8DB4FC|nr:helix-turn-helix transcriptional regulator [Knoellia subterranea]